MAPVEARMPIAGIYDFSWVVAKAQEDANRPLFVDVGGGRGHAILAIHDEFPALPLSRCVLQDRPEVIKVVSALGDEKTRQIPKMVIDFHNEQPIRGKPGSFLSVAIYLTPLRRTRILGSPLLPHLQRQRMH